MERTLTVFRVEHPDTGLGPYQTQGKFHERLASLANACRPAPSKDGLLLGEIPWSYMFGCTSIYQLAYWMLVADTKNDNAVIVANLHYQGFKVAKYIVPAKRVIHGRSGTQVMFCPSSAGEENGVVYHEMKILLDHRALAQSPLGEIA